MRDQEDTPENLLGTEYGTLPDGWEILELGDVATLQRGKDLPVSDRQLGSYPVVGSNGVVGYHVEAVSSGPGVLVGRSGSVGKVTWIAEDYWPLNTALWVRDFHDNDPRYVFYLLSYLQLSRFAAGVSVPTLNRNLIHPVKVAVPPLTEQEAIAHVLSTLQETIETTDQVIEATRELMRSLTNHLLTYGPVPMDEADQVPLRETEIGPVPEHWQAVCLEEVATLQRGKDLPQSKRQPGRHPVVGSNGVVGSHSRSVADGPGVLVGRSGSVGKVTWVEKSYWPLNTALWVKDFHGNDAAFVYRLLGTIDFSKYTAGVSVPTLNRNLVHPVVVGVPPLQEQQEIAHILGAMDEKIAAEESLKSSLDDLFKTLLHNMMTGKLTANDIDLSEVEGVA